MNETPRTNRKWARWAFRLAAALVVLALALTFIIHTAAVRRWALRRAVATLQESYALALRADDLDYNLAALRISLSGLRVSALTSPEEPFFEARRVTVTLHDFTLRPQLEAIVIDGGRVRVVRRADGGTNLPPSRDGEGEPEPLRLGYINAPRLAITLRDEASRSDLRLPALDVAIGSTSGRIDLREPGRLARGDESTAVHELRGGLAFDGRSLELSQVVLRTDELSATLNGGLALIVDEPRATLRFTARGDLPRLARWGGLTEAPRGTANVDGTVNGPFDALVTTARVRSPQVDWRDIRARDVAASLRIDSDALRIEKLRAAVAGGGLEASGAVPFGERDTAIIANWSDLDLQALAAMLGLDLEPRPTGRATGALHAGGPGFDLDRWSIDASTRTGGGETGHNRAALDGRIDLHVDRGAWRLRAEERVAGLPVTAALHGRLRFDDLQRSSLAGTVTLPGAPVQQVLDALRRTGVATIQVAATEGTVRADATVSGTFARPAVRFAGEGRLADVSGIAPGTPLTGAADLRFEGDLRTARVEAELPALNARATAVVTLDAPFNATVDAAVSSVDLERLLQGIDTPVPITGVMTASAHATGPLEEWERGEVSVEVASLEARVGALPVRLAVPAYIEYADRIINVGSLEVLAGETRVSAFGALPVTTSSSPGGSAPEVTSLLVTATGDLAQFISAVAATGLSDMPDVSGTGPAALLARITGTVQDPHVVADLELGPGTLRAGDLPAATDVRLRAHSDGESIDVRYLGAEWQGSRIEASGRAPVAWAGLKAGPHPDAAGTLSARVTSITPQVLAPFVEPDTLAQIDGSMDATIRLESRSLQLNDLAGELRLDRMDLRVADLPVTQRQPTRITVRDGFARVATWEWTGQGGSIAVQGQVRLSDRQSALLANGRFDLRMLTPFTRDAGVTAAGSLEPRLSITGPLDNPRVDGVATIVDAEMRVAEPRVIATGLDGRIVLTQTRAQLTTLSGAMNGGTLSGTGTVDYGPRQPLEAALSFDVRGMAMEFPEGLRSELNAALGVEVHVPAADVVEPDGAVTGTITVLRGAYREPIAVATGLLTALRTRRLAADVGAAEPSLVDHLTLNIRVVTEEDVVVDNNVGQLQLGTDVRVIGTVAAPSLAGRAMLREGGQLFLGRNRYTIESGTIDFINPETIEPEVNITAHTRAGGQDITLTLKGTAEQPEVDLRSSPDDLGQADIASLLLTGRRLDEITGDEAEIVGEQALAYLSGDVLGFASRAVGLDTLRLGGVEDATASRDPSAIASEIDPAARLTFGKTIGRDFDVTLSQSLRDGDAQTWIVDYRPRRQVELRFVSDDDDLRSYEFRHDVSFGGASLAQPSIARRTRRREPQVGEVSISGAATVPENRVRAALRLEPGDEFDFAEWQRDRDRIEQLLQGQGFYEARISSRRTTGNPVTLEYSIVEGPRTAIEVSGYSGDAATRDALRRAWTQAVFDEFLIDEAEAIVESALARDGYLQASVDASFTRSGDTKTLTVRVEPGARVSARRVRFETEDAALLQALEEWAAARPAGVQTTEDPAGFERALTAWLRSRGHLRARVTVGAPFVERSDAIVPVTVDAGPAFTIADVRIEGTTLDAATLRGAAGLAPGAPFDPAAVEAARDRLTGHYRRQGFASARVEAQTAIDEQTRSASVRMNVVEGPRQVVREIDVHGNRAIDTDIITRALDLPVGEPVGAGAWLEARRRVFQTGLFRRVEVTPEPVTAAAPDAAVQPMRARVTVQEWPALRLRYGFQVAEERPEGEVEGRDLVPGLSADITRRTLFGRAVTVGAALDYQRRERRGRAFLSAPTMLGWPIESSLLLERSRQEFTAVTLVTDRSGVSWEQRLRFRPNLRLSYAYRFDRDHTFDTDPDPDFPFDLTVNIARLNASAAFDTRDDPADTTRGLLLASSVDYAPRALGSEIRFARQLAQAYYFRPWRSVVLASAARFGVASGLGGEQLILSERFFAGGSRTVRGVREDGLGPRDFLGEAAGGEGLLILNQEARFPIYRWVRGVAFLDAGNVFEEFSGVALGDLTVSSGFGIRLSTPFTLLRLDYGRLFSPGPGERSGRWYFGIGQAF